MMNRSPAPSQEADPVGVTKAPGIHYLTSGMDSMTAGSVVRVGIRDPPGVVECLTAMDDNMAGMQPCIPESNTQRWWKDYSSGSNGNFLLKFLHYNPATRE